MSNKELVAKIAALEATVAEQSALLTQSAQASAARHRKVRVLGLGLVFDGEKLPRMEFQDRLFAQNEEGWTTVGADGEKRTVHLTDAQLVILNQIEHPMCEGRMDLGIIKGMRRLYNEGKHSKAFPIPTVKSREHKAEPVAPVAAEPVAEPVAEAVNE